jgi:translin
MTDEQATVAGGGLDAIAQRIRRELAAKSAARDQALADSRELVRDCSLAIRAVHRGEAELAESFLTAAGDLAAKMALDLTPHPDLYAAGYVQDGLKEYAEATAVYALVKSLPLPEPESIQVPYAAYLNGLAEAIGELRRYILDALRRGDFSRCEQMLQAMDDIYTVLVTMDFPDALTSNLRRSTDVARGITEKTRGDLTYALRQRDLEESLHAFELRLEGVDGARQAPDTLELE